MTLINIYADLQPGSDFMKRCEAALLNRAAVIRGEAANVPFHEQRLVWSRRVEEDATAVLKRMKVAIARNIAAITPTPPAELTNATDPQIITAVNTEINNFLGD